MLQIRGRHLVAAGILIAMLLAWSPRAHALDPSLDISQYAHTSWRVRDGAFAGSINAITQIVWFPAAPLWAFLIILLDVTIIYQLTARWNA